MGCMSSTPGTTGLGEDEPARYSGQPATGHTSNVGGSAPYHGPGGYGGVTYSGSYGGDGGGGGGDGGGGGGGGC